MKEQLVGHIRTIISRINRSRLQNQDFTLITNTCIGGIIFHDLHLRFCSPTINCGILDHDEFLLFCGNLQHYLSLPIEFIVSQWKYPVGVLHGSFGDVTINFAHYHSEEEALNKWKERTSRVRYDNLLVLMDGDNCSDNQVKGFNQLPQSRKVIITMKEYPQYQSVYAINRKDYPQGKLLEFGLLHGGARWYELFDYVHFFNTGEIRNNVFFRNR